jgi:hypothetical protein
MKDLVELVCDVEHRLVMYYLANCGGQRGSTEKQNRKVEVRLSKPKNGGLVPFPWASVAELGKRDSENPFCGKVKAKRCCHARTRKKEK